MSTYIKYWILCAAAFTSWATPTLAQKSTDPKDAAGSEYRLPLIGKITDGEKKLEGCEIITYLDNEKVSTTTTDKSGKFILGLELNAQYGIEFKRQGFISKRIVVDTHADVPAEVLMFIPLDMEVSMLPEAKYNGANTDALDFPFAVIKYDPKSKTFVDDQKYTTDMMRTNGALLLMAGRTGK